MPCPTCGIDYAELEGWGICPKCGRTRGYKQIDWVQVLTENTKLKQENEQLKFEYRVLQYDVAFYKKMWLESSNSD